MKKLEKATIALASVGAGILALQIAQSKEGQAVYIFFECILIIFIIFLILKEE